jgi:hypothetical protein
MENYMKLVGDNIEAVLSDMRRLHERMGDLPSPKDHVERCRYGEALKSIGMALESIELAAMRTRLSKAEEKFK